MTQQPQGNPTTQPTRFRVRQKVTMMVNRYEIHGVGADGTELGLWGFAQQKRMAFKEQVTFYADAGKSQPVFGFKARTRMDLGATYDVTDAAGQPIGQFRKDFGRSLLRSTWHLTMPDGRVALGRERNQNVAIARRVWDLVPIVGEIPVPFLFHFDFALPDGQVVLTSTKRPALRDVYEVDLPLLDGGQPIDWRVGAAMAVALDALQSR
ncbi:hypothetical protein N802_06440 [Knoellia sinensis KCTC 19936]|uniref:Uncharacterized protein n=1 Tax=Knoellia sinensis KCTC 19936 TaxID=1385520 RepID=A0A0A0IZN2_9MICO|nr:hypothetical protein [Knoellia sinensis]KGN30630.1 hypothetical protein N802_06440 [Knoellia sinensis KCTC 19936]